MVATHMPYTVCQSLNEFSYLIFLVSLVGKKIKFILISSLLMRTYSN